jgi:hypothetical protein
MKDYFKILISLGIIVVLAVGIFVSKGSSPADLEQFQSENLSTSSKNIVAENSENPVLDQFHQQLAEKPVGTKEVFNPYTEVTFLGKEEDEDGNEIAKFQAEFTTLPKTKADLTPIDSTWYKKGDKWVAGENLFVAEVDGNQVYIEAGNDQPFSGAKAGDNVTYNPQLFVGDKEYKALSKPTLLSTDPTNENYHNNVLEWDYGIAKRRLRIIEGNIQGSWVFNENPGDLVRIKYNQSGKLALNLGYASVAGGGLIKVTVLDDDEEIVPASELAREDIVYPIVVADSSTFYPDADPETNSVDGRALHNEDLLTWATLVAAAGTWGDANVAFEGVIDIRSSATSDRWRVIQRGIFLFDTSSLPDDAEISAATLSLFGAGKADSLGIIPDVNIYSSNPASNTDVVAGDYDSLGSTAFSTAITYANWVVPGYNDFTLNSSGIAAISKTGISKFGTRNANYDVSETAPSWTSDTYSFLRSYFAEQGSGYEPKLVVTYSVPWQPRPAGVQPGGSGGFFMF